MTKFTSSLRFQPDLNAPFMRQAAVLASILGFNDSHDYHITYMSSNSRTIKFITDAGIYPLHYPTSAPGQLLWA